MDSTLRTPVFLREGALVDFADRRLWESTQEDDRLRHFVACEMRLRECDELFARHAFAFTKDHTRTRDLAPFFIGYRNESDLRDRRMRGDHRLDFRRINIL